jgi:hypothetical protein
MRSKLTKDEQELLNSVEEGDYESVLVEDALHVAISTISGCDLIVSWNFKHIVHFDKIPKYNAVNVLNGYGRIGIYSPLEVIKYGNS